MADERPYRQWLDGLLARYRQLGFFQRGEYAGLAGADLRAVAVGDDGLWIRDRYFDACQQPEVLRKLERLVASRDRWRIWNTDPEQAVACRAFYARGLEALARISDGRFAPGPAEEYWLDLPGDDHPVIFMTIPLPDGEQRLWIQRRGDFAR